MALGPQLAIRQTQALVMTPQLQQAIRLLALSNLEIEAVIADELARNPLLEAQPGEGGEGVVVAPDRETAEDAPDPAGADDLIRSLQGEADQPLDHDRTAEALETDSFADVGPRGSGEEAFDFDRLSAADESLTQHLLDQLHRLHGPLHGAAVAIVRELEETGYLTASLDDIGAAIGTSPSDMKAALKAVQACDPPGIAARNLAECLALQAMTADRYDPAMARLIDNLDLLARGNLTALKRICGVDDEDLADMIRELRGYDPKPGCRFSGAAADAVAPDIFVTRTRDGWAVELNSATLPRLIVNRRYYQQLRSSPQTRESRAWLSDCLASAGWLTKALDQRARTIVRVTTEIVRQQEGFFRDGVAALKPLTLARVAEAVGVHESTVSRVTSNKYLLCDRGLYELKYFFGSGVAADGGEGAAAEAVKAALGRLIAAETEILSDDALVDLLKAEGFDLARRTVAKYREAMGIGSSVQRRRRRAIRGEAA